MPKESEQPGFSTVSSTCSNGNPYQRELSSGYQINDASDSPSQTPELIQLGSSLRHRRRHSRPTSQRQTETTAADQAIKGQHFTASERGDHLARRAITHPTRQPPRKRWPRKCRAFNNNWSRSPIRPWTSARSLAATRIKPPVPIRYGERHGVDRLTPQTSTRHCRSRQECRSAADGAADLRPGRCDRSSTANNTFACCNLFTRRFRRIISPAIANALTSLQSSTYVNQQQAYYGAAEQQLTNGNNDAANQITNLRRKSEIITTQM